MANGRKDGILNAIPMKATMISVLHSPIFVNSSDFGIVPSAGNTLSAGDTFAGFADKIYDSTDYADGELFANVWRSGSFKVPAASVSGTKKIGSRIKISSAGALAVTTTEEFLNVIGVIVGFEGSDPIINIGNYVDKKFGTTLTATDDAV